MRGSQRERLVLFAVAGLTFSLIAISLVVLSFRPAADAKQDADLSSIAPTQSLAGTITLYAPEKFVRAGTALSSVSFKEMYWPRHNVPEGAITDIAELRGQYAKVDLPPAAPLQRSQLTREPLVATLPLTPGNRAVAIAVDETSGIEGHALPGTRVDVILTYYEEGQLTSKVIVQNARVLSLGGDTSSGPERDRLASRRSNTTLTLDVSPKDALTIQTARQLGRISLVMRSSDDDKAPAVVDVKQTDIEGGRTNRSDAKRACTRGRIRMEGREYILECDGSLSEVVNPGEP